MNSGNQENSGGQSRDNRVPLGTWGGRQVGLEVTARGGSIEFDCAHGAINEPLVLDRDGNFSVRGTYEAERPGPRREGESPNAREARYAGSFDRRARTLTLTVTLTDRDERIGTFTLRHGVAPRIVKCL